MSHVAPDASRYDHHTGFPIEGYLKHQQSAPTCCLFDHRLISGGDKEFGNRVHNAGYTQQFATDVTMYHPTRNSLNALVAKDLRVGRGLCQLQRRHPDRYGTPDVPPRPTGIKRPDRTLPLRDRLVFSLLSKYFTGNRAVGYYNEYLTGTTQIDGGSP